VLTVARLQRRVAGLSSRLDQWPGLTNAAP
jgi:hypothetical protein